MSKSTEYIEKNWGKIDPVDKIIIDIKSIIFCWLYRLWRIATMWPIVIVLLFAAIIVALLFLDKPAAIAVTFASTVMLVSIFLFDIFRRRKK